MNESNPRPNIENMAFPELVELVCQLRGRACNPACTKELHDFSIEAQDVLVKRIAELEAQLSGWVRTDEELPESGSEVLFCQGKRIFKGWFDDYGPDTPSYDFFCEALQKAIPDVNCWQPLPPPPDQEPSDG